MVIKICHEEADVFPWTLANEKGLADFEIRSIEKELNIKFDIKILPWKRCQTDTQNGIVDGIFAASVSDKRMEWGVYPTANGKTIEREYRLHTDSFYVYASAKKNIKFVNGKIENLHKSAVGIQLGYSIEDELKKAGYKVFSSLITANDVFTGLSKGTFNAAILQNYEAAHTLNNGSLKKEIIRLEPAYKLADQYLLFNKLFYERNKDLSLLIWKAIRKVRLSKEYAELEKKLIETPAKRF